MRDAKSGFKKWKQKTESNKKNVIARVNRFWNKLPKNIQTLKISFIIVYDSQKLSAITDIPLLTWY